MKRILLYSFMITMGGVFNISYAQQHKTDSLQLLIKGDKEDSNKVIHLLELSRQYRSIGSADSDLLYAKQAENISEKINYINGKIACSNSIGSWYGMQANYKESLKYLLRSLEMSQQINNKEGIAMAVGNIGLVYFHQADYPNAMKYMKQALKLDEEMGKKKLCAAVNGNIGLTYYHEGNYPEALEYQLNSLKLDEEINNKVGLGYAYGNIGILYDRMGDYSRALDYELKSLETNKEIGAKNGMADNYLNMGTIYMELGKYSKALDYEQHALEIEKEVGDKEGMGIDYGDIGDVYNHMGNYAEALKNHKQALKIDEEIGNKYGMCYAYDDMGLVLSKEKQNKLAEEYLDSAMAIAKNNGTDLIKVAYEDFATFDSATGNYSRAFEDYKKYIIYRDSLINEKNTKKLVQEQMQYNFDKQEAGQKAEQDKKDAIAAQDRKKQVIIRNFFVAGFVLVLALAFFIFRGYREKQKANEIITRQKEEVEHQKEIVEEKQKEIVDSIHYAERIQKALLASEDLLKENLPEYFVLYKPKDIVSGDFYWATKKDGRFYLAVCDSTGHGVPGAFMSLLNISFLNEAINEKGIGEPNKVLDHTRRRLIENISQEGGQDGMDGVLVTIREAKEGKELRYAAAYNKPIIIRDDEAIELEADKMPVGKSPRDGEGFREYTVSLQKGDMIYLYTDGYGDQFGGEKGKKYKYTQLKQKLKTMSRGSMEEQRRMLDKEFENWRDKLEQTDDVCVMGIRI